MKICCPKCSFTRVVDDASIPASAQVAICPKCGERFNFRTIPPSEAQDGAEETEVTPDTAAKRYEGIANIENQDGTPRTPGKDGKRDLWDSIEALGDQWEKRGEGEDAAPRARAGEGRDTEHAPPSRSAAPSRKGSSAGARPRRLPGGHSESSEIPWETAKGIGYFTGFFRTVSRVILSAPRFFSSLELQRPPLRSVVFYILANLLPTFMTVVYLLSFRRAEIEPYLESVHMSADAFFGSVLLISPLQALASLFFFSFIINGVLRILGVLNVRFNKTLRIMAYAGAPTVLSFIPILGSIVAFVLGVVVIAQGLRYAYGASWRHVVMAMLPPYLIAIALFVSAARLLLPAILGLQ